MKKEILLIVILTFIAVLVMMTHIAVNVARNSFIRGVAIGTSCMADENWSGAKCFYVATGEDRTNYDY